MIVSTLLGAVALIALVALIYSTVDQVRPATVLRSIVQSAQKAREKQTRLFQATAEPIATPEGQVIVAGRDEYLVEIDTGALYLCSRQSPQQR